MVSLSFWGQSTGHLQMSVHKRALSLINRFVEEANIESAWYEDPDLFLSWLSVLYTKTTKSTFSSYRKWLARYARDIGCIQLEQGIRAICVETSTGRPNAADLASKRTTNKSIATLITQKDINTLAGVLLSNRGQGKRYKFGVLAFTWLQVTLMVGVRPSEWHAAQLLTNVSSPTGIRYPWVLEVTTSKKGNHQSQPTEASEQTKRRLILQDWPQQQIEFLQLFLSELPATDKDFKKMYESIRQTLMKASNVAGLGERAIGLYTGRHIFATEIRRQGDSSRYDLAALLGHKDTFNQRYYGDHDKTKDREFQYTLPKPWPGVSDTIEKIDRTRYRLIYGSEEKVNMMIKTGQLNLDQ